MEIAKLNEERKKQKISIAELAEKANIPKGTVEKVLFGIVKDPRSSTIQAIEQALGLNQQPEWTDEEKALGVGRHKTYLSEDDYEWLELKSEILRIHGENYLNTLKTMLNALTKE